MSANSPREREESARFNEDGKEIANSGKCGACLFYMKKKGIKYLTFIILAHVWAAVGGAIMMKIEGDYEKKADKEYEQYLNETSYNISNSIVDIYSKSAACTVDKASARKDVYGMIHTPMEPSVYGWDYAGSVFFCITILSTIGYGNKVPVSTGGKTFTMVFGLIGVPLFVAALNALSKLLTPPLLVLWKKIRRNGKKLIICLHLGNPEFKREDTDGVLTTEDLDDLEEFDVPALFAIFLFAAWTLMWSAIFVVSFDGWTFFQSFYFLYITNTTIGLGDIVPPNAVKGLILLPILLVSLALLSMTIGVLTDCLEDSVEDVVFEDVLKWDTDSSDEEKKKQKPKPQTGTKNNKQGLGVLQARGQNKNAKNRALAKQQSKDSTHTNGRPNGVRCQAGRSYIMELKDSWVSRSVSRRTKRRSRDYSL